jgi:hypothetical protein
MTPQKLVKSIRTGKKEMEQEKEIDKRKNI